MYGTADPATAALTRAASTQATTTDSTWAGAIARSALDDAIAAAASLSAGADLIIRGRKVDLTGIAHLTVPGRVVSAAAAGAWVKEGQPVPVRAQSVTQGAVLEPRKLGVISVFTSEPLRRAAVRRSDPAEHCARGRDSRSDRGVEPRERVRQRAGVRGEPRVAPPHGGHIAAEHHGWLTVARRAREEHVADGQLRAEDDPARFVGYACLAGGRATSEAFGPTLHNKAERRGFE
jgi:hypothetical protein